jgi:hypothetical protein
MRALQLDFQRRPRSGVAGWLLLGVGVAALAGTLHVHRMLAQEAGEHGAAMQRIEAALPAAMTRSRAQETGDDPSLVAARQAIEHARLPWNGLFAALESADSEDVALLAITPDVTHHRVKIHAEARNLDAMLAFHRHLQHSDGLAEVVLVDHVVSKEPETPVRFHVFAGWGAGRASP